MNPGRRRAARGLLAPVVSTVVYFLVRPILHSDAAALAVAGAVPAAYAIVAALLWHRIELIALLSAAAFALAGVVSLVAGGSALPLKLHEAGLTFLLGIVLLVAVLIRRPLPVSRVLKVPDPSSSTDETFGVVIGAFLIGHALLQLVMALTMSTSEYLTVGRGISWAVLAAGLLGLWSYLRRLRRPVAPTSG